MTEVMQTNLKARLKAFLMNQTTETEFVITSSDVAELSREDVQEVNVMIEASRRLDGSDGFRVESATNPGDAIRIFKDPGKKPNNVYEGGKADERVSNNPPDPGDNPFRPRYRKLGPKELDHHDKIKLQAMDLLTTFRQIPTVRTQDGQTNDGEGMANIKLAQRHLEDAVYRAVKALTA